MGIVMFALLIAIGSVQIGVSSENIIIISPSCGSNSPSSCATLSQYISTNNEAAASLVLLSGVHTLMSPLRVQNGEFFYLQGQEQSSQVTISCFNSSSSPDFEFLDVNEVTISNLVFEQCYVCVDITGSGSNNSTVSISYAEFSGYRIGRGWTRIEGSNNVSISHSIFQNSNRTLYFSRINHLKVFHCIFTNTTAQQYLMSVSGSNNTEVSSSSFFKYHNYVRLSTHDDSIWIS